MIKTISKCKWTSSLILASSNGNVHLSREFSNEIPVSHSSPSILRLEAAAPHYHENQLQVKVFWKSRNTGKSASLRTGRYTEVRRLRSFKVYFMQKLSLNKNHTHMTSHRSREAYLFVDNPSDPCVSWNKSPPKQSNSMTNDLWKNFTKHKYYLSGIKRQSRRDVLSRLFPTDYSRSA